MADRNRARRLCRGVEGREVPVQCLSDVENRRDISAPVAVVRSGPDCNKVLVLEPVFEAVHDELMSTGDQLKVVDVAEFGGHL